MFNEESLENMTIETLRDELGYDYESGENIDRDHREVLLKDRLFNSLLRINPKLDDNDINEAIRKISNFDSGKVSNNREFLEYLHKGVSVPKNTGDGEKYINVKLIDFENIGNNDFLVVNQFSVVEVSLKRPDVVIFINGIPIVVMELKSSVREEVKLYTAFNQLAGYMNFSIPKLFYYNQLLIISDGVVAKLGTITSPLSRFSEWKKISVDDETNRISTHDSLILGLLNKRTLLNVIENYMLFSNDDKITPAYHQYYGVEKAINRTLSTTDGKAGIIWHTQGSGKSFSMVFYVGNMINRLKNPTILIVTDRNDLDNQLFETFSKCSYFLKQSPEQVESRLDLKERLEGRKVGGIIFTTLQKFEDETGVLSLRDDILVIVDEAHRSHYGIDAKLKFDEENLVAYKKYGTAKYLHDGLPNAKYIGFTGTPVESRDKSTKNIFGEVIDVYDMTQSIEDGSTVQIFYESRMAKVGLNYNVLEKIDNYYQSIEDDCLADVDKISESKKEMANMRQILEAPDRLEMIVKDIIDHYEDRKDLVANKVMIVAYSRNSAYLMYQKFLELKPEYDGMIKMVITPSNSDSSDMQIAIGTKKDKKELEVDFKNPDSNLKIAIVVDMWLTGFDVPCLGTMYIDKPMKEHSLMQAIARVNRVYKDKSGGLVVDYIGLKKYLLEALKTYTQRDQSKIVANDEIVKVLKDKVELVRNQFHGFKYDDFSNIDDRGKYNLIIEGANHILKSNEVKKDFMDNSLNIKGLYSVCTGGLDEEFKDEVLYVLSVRSFISKIGGDKLDISEINKNVAKMLDDAINNDELITIGNVAKSNSLSLLNDDILSKLAKMKSKNIAAEVLNRALKDYIKQIGATNIVLMEKFSERFKKITDAYNERTSLADIEKIIEEMINLKKEIEEEMIAGNKFDLSQEEKAFFDALGKDPSVKECMKDEVLVQIAKELVDVINSNMTIDWEIKEKTRAAMRMEIKKMLRKYDYPPKKEKGAIDIVIRQAELKCKNTFA